MAKYKAIGRVSYRPSNHCFTYMESNHSQKMLSIDLTSPIKHNKTKYEINICWSNWSINIASSCGFSFSLFIYGLPWQKHLFSICRSCVCPVAEWWYGLEAVEAWWRPSIQFPPSWDFKTVNRWALLLLSVPLVVNAGMAKFFLTAQILLTKVTETVL